MPNARPLEASCAASSNGASLPLDVYETDVVVLGGGLAGVRAAMAARDTQPDCRVTVVTSAFGPSGSSFANPNNALGMQVCLTREDKADFMREVLELAAPGQVDAALVALLAEESLARFHDLKALGVSFAREPGGDAAPGCFSPTSRRAAIVNDLTPLFSVFKDFLARTGVRWLPGWLAVATLAGTTERVGGVLLVSRDESRALAIRASSVVVALGGPAPLFPRHLAGPGNPGYGLGLLRRAGASLINAGFLQFFWSALPSRHFFPMHTLFAPTAGATMSKELYRALGDVPDARVVALAAERAGHCPCAYDRPDAVLDAALLGLADAQGIVHLSRADGQQQVALFAHAGNGGARIDTMGRTSVPGLFAVGECAGGMHGANRLGGAMVLATQVFGARAGTAAALEASHAPLLPQRTFRDLARRHLAGLRFRPDKRARGLHSLGQTLSRDVTPCLGAGCAALLARSVRRQLARPTDWWLDLARETVFAIISDPLARATLSRPEPAA